MEKIKHYSEEEILYLKENYATAAKQDILYKLKRSWISIQKKAFLLGLKRINYESKNNHKYSKLLLETPETYYWLGLLMSDGHFNKNHFITLSINDIEHTNKLRSYLGMEKTDKKLISISDMPTFKKLTEKFKINNNKTYEPCDLSCITNEDLLFSLIIGFIDGDGTISNKYLGIVSHKNWYNNLYLFNQVLKNTTNIYYSNKLINIRVSRIKLLKEIKQRAISLKLPFLERKWNKINLEQITKNEKKDYCFQQFEKGLSPVDIIKLGVAKKCVYKYYAIYRDIKNNNEIFNSKDKMQYCFQKFDEGYSKEQIINSGKVSRSCVYRNYKKYHNDKPKEN